MLVVHGSFVERFLKVYRYNVCKLCLKVYKKISKYLGCCNITTGTGHVLKIHLQRFMFLINKALEIQRQANINDKNRRFGVFMTPFSRRSKITVCVLLRRFSVLKKCRNKFDCLVNEMLFIRDLKPTMNVQSDSIRAKVFT